MKISILSVGSFKTSPFIPLIKEYLTRINYTVQFIEIEFKKKVHGQKTHEALLIQKALPSNAYIVALDEKGKHMTSPELAKHFEDQQVKGHSHFVFIIGGADGLAQEILSNADLHLSFGRLTWPHQMVRLMLLEQIYRVQQILSGHPYHRA
ncbi:23S rRNA (pseudouridine(1915)-N(3))-methyltransferase RlmH [Candidatus Nucleicultrix amoebiphila]|jgi:23S rRNA (pseudouridine1915-N3)-methyltransferase|uniref:Ribosomal RNA large subunit methyltransferase H n=1 Tax=Candidatus Nucleicultrix amoebiphila FS5 TaxID=1414854 RepID=A0A1W6N320_9PROT|nr:23S rRNA (pseudouridine(1915)-N(3))-methyltransferase RlmH [Candidatus Nucleicultrix amoebiphila]ARN84198.1 hypothetical protein GQ61_01295 [Candidatus Nucleicultrix amoebiphila FS5]